MHALMTNSNYNLPVIVNMESREFAELSVAGYVPLQTGYRKILEELEKEMMEEICAELDIISDN